MARNKSYTKAQIKFIMSLKKQGRTYEYIAEAYGRRYGDKKTANAIAGVFHAHKDVYDLDSPKAQADIKPEVLSAQVLEDFIDLVERLQYVPILSEFKAETGFSTYNVEKSYGSYDKLEEEARKADPKLFENIIDESRFGEDSFKDFLKRVGKHKRFLVTGAVAGCAVHADALAAAQTFCKKENAMLLTLGCADPTHTRNKKYDFVLSSDIPFESIVQRDFNLNSNLFISTIKLSAKHINPLTGLDRIAQNKGSFIFGSPKQDIEHVVNKNKKGIPRAIMTTGVITKPNYATELYLSDRTAKIAKEDHKLGAIIIEILDNKTFYYRPIQFDPKTGAFTDLWTQYFANGKTKKVTAELVQFGDYHVLSTCPDAKRGGIDLVNRTEPDYLTIEDFFDGISINHHEKKNIINNSKRYRKGLTLQKELEACRDELNDLCETKAKEIVWKYGNHEDFLKRWLNSAEYSDDKMNHYEGVCLAKALLEDTQPLEYAMKKRYPIDNPKKVTFLGVNDSFLVNGIENGAHGHLGSNGKRNPGMKEVRKAYGACNVGHNHSGAVYKDAFRAGTKTHLQVGYNDGPSSWTQSDVLQHRDGSRQLITYIKGQYTTKKK